MSCPSPRRSFLISLLIAACGPAGCSPEGAGSVDLKKRAPDPPPGAPKPRPFRKGDLEER